MENDMPRRFSNCLNTGKICLFTDTGKMHQIKVMDLPYGRFRDKGVPIDNVSNYSSSEEQIVTIIGTDAFPEPRSTAAMQWEKASRK